jgi:peroxiredoxin
VRRHIPLLAVIIQLALFAACYHGSRPPRIGSAAPDFTITDQDRTVTLSQFRGHVLVLNFWATWCPPCVEEMPSLVQLQEKMKDKDVTVLGVSIDVDDDAYHRFLKERGITFMTVRDADHKTSDVYGSFKWPETYIIDREGKVRRKFIGPVDWSQPEIVDFLSKL